MAHHLIALLIPLEPHMTFLCTKTYTFCTLPTHERSASVCPCPTVTVTLTVLFFSLLFPSALLTFYLRLHCCSAPQPRPTLFHHWFYSLVQMCPWSVVAWLQGHRCDIKTRTGDWGVVGGGCQSLVSS